MTVYKLSKKAYLKIMLHAAKYPTTPVCGYLVGPKPGNSDESEESANVSAQKRSSDIDVADAMPIFHTLPTAPMLEASALLVEELYRSKKTINYRLLSRQRARDGQNFRSYWHDGCRTHQPGMPQ